MRIAQGSLILWTTSKRVDSLSPLPVMPKAMNTNEHLKGPRPLEQVERLEQAIEPQFTATGALKQGLTATLEAAEGRLGLRPPGEDRTPELAGDGQLGLESSATTTGDTPWDPLNAVGRLPAAEWNRSQPRFLGFGAGFRRPGARWR